MARTAMQKENLSESLRRFGDQFRNLDTRDPASWPPVPQYLLFLLVATAVVVFLWFVWLSSSADALEEERAKEVSLREDYTKKLAQAVNLDALKKQRAEVQQYVALLEKQLPSKAEMDALLSDINQAGLGRSLQFDLFRPGDVAVKDYYAELPIAVKVSGQFHDIGAFASDIANLSRIVTLNNLSISPSSNKDKSDTLFLEATAKTFRYLDQEERDAQQSAKKGEKK